jgi:hypothetical protein
MKFDKLTEAYMNVVKEGKTQLRKYRVGLDRPGSGWETIISAKSEKEAIAKANSAYEFGNNKPNEKANYVHDITDETEQKESSPNLYTDILNPLHAIIGDADHVGDALNNLDDLVHFLIQKNPSIQSDLLEYIKSKSYLFNK